MKNTRRNKITSAAIWLIVLASGTGLFIVAQTPTPQVNEIRELATGQTLEREMAGVVHLYKISLRKNEFTQVQVEQGSLLLLKLLDSEGNELITSERPKGAKSSLKTLSILHVATSDRDYFLEVVFPKSKIQSKTYKINRNVSRESTEAERISLADFLNSKASKSGEEANSLLRKSQISPQEQNKTLLTSALRRTIAQYKEASNLYADSVKDIYRILCYTMIGINFRRLDEISNSLVYLNDALNLTNEKGLYDFLPMVINEIAEIHFSEGREEIALDYLQRLELEDLKGFVA